MSELASDWYTDSAVRLFASVIVAELTVTEATGVTEVTGDGDDGH